MGKNNEMERRSSERYKSGIPVLIKSKEITRVLECTLIDISKTGFAVRIEHGKIKMDSDEHFILSIDPALFELNEYNSIEINSICKRIDLDKKILGAIFYKNNELTNKYLENIIFYFKKINENLY
ncbi:PilZ domain-containing protein [Pigmentibacter sp. JX0631]|uniref:PilZ domain-containing protein n=1 Tax=Pigmentibacter sp. JX0631 TaxID=2976982 RepID=UPI002469646B|nr:PilZ domain-containing protein [Pigmentibacter sp. JX0631]WGL58810.1 PilZ domain-containing protein [Pigmentibacter sp. JX0631]